MRPYGSDQLRAGKEGLLVLSCHHPKPGWQPRVEKTPTTPEHPGTAVLWGGEFYEVVGLESLREGVRYTLAPWKEEHTMRGVDRYDESSEEERAAVAHAVLARRRIGTAAVLLAFLTGHLPAPVQERLASESGVDAPRLTMFSTLPPVVLLVVCLRACVGARIESQSNPVSPLLMMFALYMTLDAAVRFSVAYTQRRPLGSIPGWIAYALFYALSRRRLTWVSPFAQPQGSALFRAELTPQQRDEGALTLREPLFTLLPAAEQRRLAERHAYDFRRSASAVAWLILLFSALGVVTSIHTMRTEPRVSAAISLAVAAWLAAEQVFRLTCLRQRPVGSVLGYLLLPLAARFLRAP